MKLCTECIDGFGMPVQLGSLRLGGVGFFGDLGMVKASGGACPPGYTLGPPGPSGTRYCLDAGELATATAPRGEKYGATLNTTGNCPSGFHLGPPGGSGNRYCIPDSAGTVQMQDIPISPMGEEDVGPANLTAEERMAMRQSSTEGGAGGGGIMSSLLKLLSGGTARAATSTADPFAPKSNTGVVIAATVGGLAVVAAVVYVVSKKKK